MQAFLDNFDMKKSEGLERNIQTEKNIVALLEQIKNLAKHESMPSQSEHRELQGDLKFKEKEMKNSENTMDALMIGKSRSWKFLSICN
jgi:intraflagellar transport protein 74